MKKMEDHDLEETINNFDFLELNKSRNNQIKDRYKSQNARPSAWL